MDYNTLLLTKNDCYKAKKRMTPKGIIVHSTGANNPNLKRYVGPNDGRLGENHNKNHWNHPGLSTCVHAFIGKDKDGIVCTYQTLPLYYCAWGVGSGKKGSYNYDPAYLQFEICEDNLTDETYFKKVMKEAQELCARWCEEFNLSAKDVISHKEAHAKGYGSNHGDCDHWLKKHGKNMKWFRKEVEKLLKSSSRINVGDKVKLRPGITKYHDGKKVSAWVKKATLYVRKKEVKNGEDICLVSTSKSLPIYTGRFNINDIVKK
jgi:N-acetylmuramoyl-L-alanine amidase